MHVGTYFQYPSYSSCIRTKPVVQAYPNYIL